MVSKILKNGGQTGKIIKKLSVVKSQLTKKTKIIKKFGSLIKLNPKTNPKNKFYLHLCLEISKKVVKILNLLEFKPSKFIQKILFL